MVILLKKFSAPLRLFGLPPYCNKSRKKIALKPLSACRLVSFVPSMFFYLLLIDSELRSHDRLYLLGRHDANKLPLLLVPAKGASPEPCPTQAATISSPTRGALDCIRPGEES